MQAIKKKMVNVGRLIPATSKSSTREQKAPKQITRCPNNVYSSLGRVCRVEINACS